MRQPRVEPPAGICRVLLDERGEIAADIPCANCGDSLYGQAPDATCRRCGRPVAQSFGDDLLRLADPRWLTRLDRGAFLLTRGLLLSALSVALCATGLTFVFVGSPANGQTFAACLLLSTILGVPSAALITLGMWWVTTPDPTGRGERAYGGSRDTTRLLLVLGLLAIAVATALAIPALRGSAPLAILVFVPMLAFVGTFSPYTLFRYLAPFARRAPDRKLASRASVTSKTASVTAALGFLAPVGPCVVVLLIPLWVIVFALAYGALHRLRHVLRDQIELATQLAATGAPAPYLLQAATGPL